MKNQANATQLGNVWVLAATMAQGMLDEDPEQPKVLTIDEEGALEAFGPEHAEYERKLLSAGYVCGVTKGMAVERLAARIRAAALRTGRVT